MTLMVRDEADIIERQLDFHLAAGVDFFVVTDHESADGTSEILERYARRGLLHRIPVVSSAKRQAEWVTGMARMAAEDFGADWVINSDADEFWWPWGGDLKEVLARVPERYGIVQTFVRAFLPRPGEGDFAERMTVRFAPSAPINSPFSPFSRQRAPPSSRRARHRRRAGKRHGAVVSGRATGLVGSGGLALPRSQLPPVRAQVPDSLQGVRCAAPRRTRARLRGVANRPTGCSLRRDLHRRRASDARACERVARDRYTVAGRVASAARATVVSRAGRPARSRLRRRRRRARRR